MDNTLPHLSGRIDPDWVDALRLIQQTAQALHIPYVLIGAAARDFWLMAYGLASQRATRDVDLALEITGWNRFEALRTSLLTHKTFKPDRMVQRLIFKGYLAIDLLPYGGVEKGTSQISWPPDHTIEMSVLGLADALKAAKIMRLAESPEPLDMPVATPASIALLKLLAWDARKHESSKDAEDFQYLLYYYIDMGNQSHLENAHIDLFEDIETASARLLGRDIAQIASPSTLQTLGYILQRETAVGSYAPLITAMLPRHADEDTKQQYLRLLQALQRELGSPTN
jgi:predicted nucleotidyltransferase